MNEAVNPILQKDLAKPIAKAAKNIFNYMDTYWHYYNTLSELYTTRFKWAGFPEYMYEEGADVYLESVLCTAGKGLFFYDDILDKYLTGGFAGTKLNWYGFPIEYTATLQNGYSNSNLNDTNAVRIYNSSVRTGEVISIKLFADRLATCDLILFLNLHAQKVPYIVKTTTQNKLSWDNFINQLDSFEPKIIVNKELNIDDFDILQTGVKYLGNEIIQTKKEIWSEALSYLGVASSLDKRERLTVNEQQSFNADSNALLLTGLAPRQEAADNINRKFGLNVSVEVRQDLQLRVDMLNTQFYSNILGMGNGIVEENKEVEGVE